MAQLRKKTNRKKSVKRKYKLKPFDKYEYYLNSVQAPDLDTKLFAKMYRQLKGRSATTLREDFCGSYAVCCEWVKLGPKNRAIGVDLDTEPIVWGDRHNLSKLTESQQRRLNIINGNVLNPKLPHTDITVAQNFSYFLFKRRNELKAYFKNVYNTLNSRGVFIVDCFGGGSCTEPNEEETKYRTYSYFWDQDTYNPINCEAKFYIHFKRKGERKREKVFAYDWRIWSMREIREIMEDVGFKKTHVYWEGTDRRGNGDGNFKKKEVGDVCEAFISYIVAEK